MRRGKWADDPEALRRTARDGVIRTAALRGLGVPGATITNRCADGGRWTRLLPGVIMLTGGTATPRQRVSAALLYGGPDAVVTGLEACRRHGVRRGPDPRGAVHLLVPDDRQLRSCEFVTVERTIRLPAPLLRDGVPLAPVPRACLDAARRLQFGRPDHRADRRHRPATALHAGAPRRRVARGQPAGFRHAAAGAGRRRRRSAVDGRARRQASSRAQQPARAVVERGGADSSGTPARDRGRLVRRGRTRLGDQLLRVAPAAAVLRERGQTHRGADGGGRDRASRASDVALRDDGDRSPGRARDAPTRRPTVVPVLRSLRSGARELAPASERGVR